MDDEIRVPIFDALPLANGTIAWETILRPGETRSQYHVLNALDLATLIVAMVPLLFAGAGLIRGFALTTIIGFTIGVLVTRPAFASIAEYLIEKES